jgi:hypothetical protein
MTVLTYRARWIISILILLFVTPFILARVFYAHQNWLPRHTTNHGQLLTPPPSLRDFSLDPHATQHRWVLLLVHPSGPCEQFCQKGLYNMRQIQLALGKDRDRLQRVLVTAVPVDQQLQQWLQDSGAGQWQGNADALSKGGTWYVVDPLGNLVLSYAAQANPEDILDDLKHLMTISNIG